MTQDLSFHGGEDWSRVLLGFNATYVAWQPRKTQLELDMTFHTNKSFLHYVLSEPCNCKWM